MLKALELVGFKSFADKTRFEFPRGITIVVGPNGSGKSNVVDAIKWVLGEQSVKSLRGKEMADVIFNGSGTRRAMNSAEITLTFDNAANLLPIDTPEVHITRRVYRSGEGEYLINRHPARLRDIRDLLSGTGMGTHAYSVIEQGKVDVLLQASPRDRRMIFEEAAGISRFKAKKIESLRRLERVEQNLLRLSDIVDEVESRLRSVRLQAGKARRYKEHTDRLQELRTQVGLTDWRRLSDQLAQIEGRMQALGDERDATVARAEVLEADLLETDTQIGDLGEAVRRCEARLSDNRERIATRESTIAHERRRSRDLETETARQRRQLVAMSARAGDLREQLRETAETVGAAEENHGRIAARLAEGERELTGVMTELDRLRGENEQRRAAYMDRMRSAASLGNESGSLQSQLDAASAALARCGQRLDESDGQLDALSSELDDMGRQQEACSRQVDEQAELLRAAEEQLARFQQQYAARQDELSRLRQRHSGTVERVAVLEELQRRHEGLSACVKEVLEATRTSEPGTGPWQAVRGLVADLLRVSVEVAPLIEVALGSAAGHVVAEADASLLKHLEDRSGRLAGRVGFLWLANRTPPAADADDRADAHDAGQSPLRLEERPGVLGRADGFVETDPEYAPLARRLLGQTWIVERLTHALELAESAGEPLNYVTLAGEKLAADGTLIVGPHQGATGLISRRSQLRALKAQVAELETEIQQTQQSAEQLAQQIQRQQQQVAALADEHRQATDAVAELRFRIAAAEQRRGELAEQRAVLESEARAAETQRDEASRQLAEAQEKRKQVDRELADMEAQLARLGEQIDRLDAQRQAHGRTTTQTKVELAKSEERLRNLRTRMRQFEESRQERRRAIDDAGEQLAECLRRAQASAQTILRTESEVAELYLKKESLAAETVALIDRRETFRQRRTELTDEAQKTRSKVRKAEEKIHAEDLAANEVRHRRGALADRLRDDYAIELAELEHEPTDEEQHQREEVEREIEELRRKISNLGHVNIEALAELDELETRHEKMAGQYRDLVEAKASLEKIIDRINTDSRRLFSETLETVTGHFRTLFRDLFGGGHGDVVLDEGVDILESGIEIVARPPGKEPRSISLLSGGEKTLTCVALLLAIFRSRPSPFCVLDEVDAALDEANIDRFTQVLQDFLAWTQFIIVTHSKKTMICADTIYGVTMQESGVSKQVSVRFEDVSEDGHIRTERLAQEDDGTQAA